MSNLSKFKNKKITLLVFSSLTLFFSFLFLINKNNRNTILAASSNPSNDTSNYVFTIKSGVTNDIYDKNGKEILKAKNLDGKNIVILDESLNGRTAELPVDTLILLKFSKKGIITIIPANGTVDYPKGTYNSPKNVIGLLKVIRKGETNITVQIANSANYTNNWSGYERTGSTGAFSDITSNWTTPTASSCNLGDTDSSHWVGIDGANSSTVLQTGTEAGCSSGSAYYQAWWEYYPVNSEQVITTGCSPTTSSCGQVSPGDQMFGEVKKNTSNWTLTLKNLTKNWSYATTQTYSGNQSSVEWITEAPTSGGSTVTLTSYGTITYLNDTQNGVNPVHSYSTDSVDMYGSDGITIISSTSQPNTNTNGFSTAYGSTAPNAPGGNWTITGSTQYARYVGIAALLSSGKVLVAGGDNSGALSQAELYNPTTKTWSTTGSLGTARKYFTANNVTISGGGSRVLVIGGYGSTSTLKSCELYNESSASWSAAANMNTARSSQASVTLSDGTVLAIGGDPVGNNSATNSVELYDPVANTWTTKANLSTARRNHTATLLNDGRVLVTGGSDTSSNALSSTEIYTPSTNTWATGPTMAYARSDQTATLLPNGKVLIAGGGNATCSGCTKAELFDPTSNTFSNAASMAYGHSGHTATLVTLSDGTTHEVLVAGSAVGGTSNMNHAELYDYINNVWKITTNLNKGRYYFTATLLNDGTVLIANGYTSAFQTRSVEYYIAP